MINAFVCSTLSRCCLFVCLFCFVLFVTFAAKSAIQGINVLPEKNCVSRLKAHNI